MKLGLGTVQFGMPYGISNTQGQVSCEVVQKILILAQEQGISVLDTASLYGVSETVIGMSGLSSFFNMVTKTPKFSEVITAGDIELLEKTLHQSLVRLRQQSLYGLLVHDGNDLLKFGGELLWDKMQELKAQGFVRKIGVSVYTADQIDQVCEKYSIDLIQVPYNVFDQRLMQSGHLKRLKYAGIEIHARSAFLQGLLLTPIDQLKPGFLPFRMYFEKYHNGMKQYDMSLLEGALQFVLSSLEIDQVIVGVTSVSQLQDIINAVRQSSTPPIFFEQFAVTDERLINPSCWSM